MIYIALFALTILLIVAGCIENRYVKRKNERCEVCGYRKQGPLHDEDRCDAEKDARTMTEDELSKRQLFRTGKEELGF